MAGQVRETGVTRLMGHVDRADSLAILGWALDLDDLAAPPLVRVIQRGEVVAATRPRLPVPGLHRRLGLRDARHPPLHGWQITLPLAGGIAPDLPFDLTLRADGRPMQGGAGLVIRPLAAMDAEAAADLAATPMVQIGFGIEGEAVQVTARALQTAPPQPLTLLVGNQPPRLLERMEVPAAPPFHRPGIAFRCTIPRARLERHARAALPVRLHYPGDEAETPAAFHHRLRTLWLPRDLFTRAEGGLPLPPEDGMRRIGGPEISAPLYRVGGLSCFLQLDALARRHAGRRLTQFPHVVDWGTGCARVLRHFAESAGPLGLPQAMRQRLTGLDIDPVNIDWCREALPDLAGWGVLRPEGFDLPPASVDLLFGISVMTHLTEHDQQRWLAEIRRVLRPGGLAILTVHGEAALFRDPASLALPFVERFGSFDGIADPALGPERARHYRASYQARGYLREAWSRHLEILEIIPAANGFLQDYVALRRG